MRCDIFLHIAFLCTLCLECAGHKKVSLVSVFFSQCQCFIYFLNFLLFACYCCVVMAMSSLKLNISYQSFHEEGMTDVWVLVPFPSVPSVTILTAFFEFSSVSPPFRLMTNCLKSGCTHLLNASQLKIFQMHFVSCVCFEVKKDGSRITSHFRTSRSQPVTGVYLHGGS